MQRREFLQKTALTAGAVAVSGLGLSCKQADLTGSGNSAKLPQRKYGQTGIRLSVIGFGGVVVKDTEQNHANRVVAEAIERGVNYFDVAPTYGDAELKLGPALEPFRKNVFLACKTTQRKAEGAAAELKESLKRLRTDHFDLYQLHAINDVKKDVEAVFAKGGAMEVFLDAKKRGQVRFLGFSAHTEQAALAAMDRYDFDSILFPVNFSCIYKGNFGPAVIAKAKSRDAAILALKAMARQKWPKDDPRRRQYSKCWYEPTSDLQEADLALRFTLAQSVTAAIPPGEESLFRLAMDLAMNIKPLSAEESENLKKLAQSMNPIFTKA